MRNGFTLIELIIYLALFSLLMLGCLSSARGIADSAERTRDEALVLEESLFVLERIRHLLNDAERVMAPLPEEESGTLTIEDGDGSRISIGRRDGSVMYTRDGVASPLTAPAVAVTALSFSGGTLDDAGLEPTTIDVLLETSAHRSSRTHRFLRTFYPSP